MIGLDQRADVYGPDAGGELGAELLHAGVPVRLVVARVERPIAGERAEPTAETTLLWGPGFVMPAESVVEIGARRYAVQGQTVNGFRNHSGRVVYQRGSVVEMVD